PDPPTFWPCPEMIPRAVCRERRYQVGTAFSRRGLLSLRAHPHRQPLAHHLQPLSHAVQRPQQAGQLAVEEVTTARLEGLAAVLAVVAISCRRWRTASGGFMG